MCWNSTVSLNTFLFSAFVIFLAALNKYPIPVLIFYASFITMQLLEYFIWKNLSDKKKNNFYSTCAGYLLLLQPIASIGLLWNVNRQLFWVLLGIYLVLVASTARLTPDHYAYVGKNGHLVWNWLEKKNINWLLISIYFIFFFLPMLLAKEYYIFGFSFAAWIVSLYFFWKYDTWGTMWCWFANLLLFFVLIKYIFPIHECKIYKNKK